MEEFERAVCLSYRNNGDDITITRHKEFVSAIEDQISRVETALKDSLEVEGNKSFRWVNLDKEECDDFAHFLSGTPGTSQMIKDDCLNIRDDDRSFGSQISPELKTPNQGEISEEVLTRIKDTDGFIELQERRSPETGHEIRYRTDETSISQSDWRLPDRNTLEIVIDTDDGQANGSTEATPKDKISKPFIWRSRGDVYHRAKEAQNHAQMRLINWINRVSHTMISFERKILIKRIGLWQDLHLAFHFVQYFFQHVFISQLIKIIFYTN